MGQRRSKRTWRGGSSRTSGVSSGRARLDRLLAAAWTIAEELKNSRLYWRAAMILLLPWHRRELYRILCASGDGRAQARPITPANGLYSGQVRD